VSVHVTVRAAREAVVADVQIHRGAGKARGDAARQKLELTSLQGVTKQIAGHGEHNGQGGFRARAPGDVERDEAPGRFQATSGAGPWPLFGGRGVPYSETPRLVSVGGEVKGRGAWNRAGSQGSWEGVKQGGGEPKGDTSSTERMSWRRRPGGSAPVRPRVGSVSHAEHKSKAGVHTGGL